MTWLIVSMVIVLGIDTICSLEQDGVMGTHEEETRRFFKDSSVQVLLCPRNAGKRHSWVKQRVEHEFLFLIFG